MPPSSSTKNRQHRLRRGQCLRQRKCSSCCEEEPLRLHRPRRHPPCSKDPDSNHNSNVHSNLPTGAQIGPLRISPRCAARARIDMVLWIMREATLRGSMGLATDRLDITSTWIHELLRLLKLQLSVPDSCAGETNPGSHPLVHLGLRCPHPGRDHLKD